MTLLQQFRQKMTVAGGHRYVDKLMDPESLEVTKNMLEEVGRAGRKGGIRPAVRMEDGAPSKHKRTRFGKSWV